MWPAEVIGQTWVHLYSANRPFFVSAVMEVEEAYNKLGKYYHIQTLSLGIVNIEMYFFRLGLCTSWFNSAPITQRNLDVPQLIRNVNYSMQKLYTLALV